MVVETKDKHLEDAEDEDGDFSGEEAQREEEEMSVAVGTWEVVGKLRTWQWQQQSILIWPPYLSVCSSDLFLCPSSTLGTHFIIGKILLQKKIYWKDSVQYGGEK